MNQKTIFTLFLAIILIGGFTFFIKRNPESAKLSTKTIENVASPTPLDSTKTFNTFSFDNFHGSKNISLKFQFNYPLDWQNDGQYFSPQKIEYYDLYSVKAPFYFDLIKKDVFKDTEFNYQITESKRRTPDSHGKINFKEFKRYDLIDYGSYGGESAGHVIIYVGPEIVIDGVSYYLVFHWEEKPLATEVPQNNSEIFENAVKSLKFF